MMKLFTANVRAVGGYFRGLSLESRRFLSEEVNEATLLFLLLLRRLRFNGRLTDQEIREMKFHFRNAAKMIYAVAIILLPGGLLFMSLVAGALHRKH